LSVLTDKPDDTFRDDEWAAGVVAEGVVGFVGADRCVASGAAAERAVPIGDAAAVDEAVAVEARRVDQVEVGPIAEERGLERIRGRLQVFVVAPDEVRVPVFREEVVDEEHVARAPCVDLAAELEIHERGGAQEQVGLAQIQPAVAVL